MGVDALLFHFEEPTSPVKYLAVSRQVTGAKKYIYCPHCTTDLCLLSKSISIIFPFYEVNIELHTFAVHPVFGDLH